MNVQDVSGGFIPTTPLLQSMESARLSPQRLIQKLGPYVVEILLDESGKFLSVESIIIDKTFLSQDQQISLFKYHDVEHFLEDED